MAMIMIVMIFFMGMIMLVMIFRMGMNMFCQYGRPETVRMQISHIMVMILMLTVEDHIKITGVQTGLDNARNRNPVAGKRQCTECLPQQLLIRSKIQQRRSQHISADSAGTVQNQGFSVLFKSFPHIYIPHFPVFSDLFLPILPRRDRARQMPVSSAGSQLCDIL
jgi:hypothetical protein